MKHSVPHDLKHDQAREATRHALESYRARFPEFKPQGQWVSPDRAEISFTAVGNTLKGVVEVLANRIDLELDVPLMMRPFQNKAMAVIEGEIRTWIEKAKAGRLQD